MDWNLVWIYWGFKTFGEKSGQFIKTYIDIIFMNVNLDGLTCMQKMKFEYKWQMTWFG
jgi:hypothetical protein